MKLILIFLLVSQAFAGVTPTPTASVTSTYPDHEPYSMILSMAQKEKSVVFSDILPKDCEDKIQVYVQAEVKMTVYLDGKAMVMAPNSSKLFLTLKTSVFSWDQDGEGRVILTWWAA